MECPPNGLVYRTADETMHDSLLVGTPIEEESKAVCI